MSAENYYKILDGAHKARFDDPQKSLDDSNSVYVYALKAGDQKLEASSLYEMGLCFELLSGYPKAMKCFSECIKISNTLGEKHLAADAFNNVGIIYDKLNNYSNALKAYLNALNIYDYLGNKKKKAIVISNIGLIYTNIHDYKSALKFYAQALEIAEDENDKESLLVTNINIGLTHLQLGNYIDAETYLYNSIEISDSLHDRQRKAMALDILAEIAISMKKFAKATEIFNSSLELKKELNDKKGISKIYSILGKLNLAEDNLEKARSFFLDSLSYASELGLKKPVYEIHKCLADVYEKRGDYRSAIEHMRKSYKMELETFKEESELKAKNMATQLEIEQVQKEAEIERLKNVELAKALKEVKQLNISLKDLNEEKNEFMAIAVHDLKNPLLNILSAARLLKNRETHSKEKTAEITESIIEQTDRMFGLIKKLLDHNAIEQGNIQIKNTGFIISELCEELIKNFKEQAYNKHISIIYENDSPGTEIYTDKVVLYEILQNLISNAVKFSPPDKRIVVKTTAARNNVNIEIIDEGPGFTDKDKEKMFIKFAKLSAKPTGNEHSTGLGLSIVKKLTDLLGGQIDYESEPGKGTKFILSLPINNHK